MGGQRKPKQHNILRRITASVVFITTLCLFQLSNSNFASNATAINKTFDQHFIFDTVDSPTTTSIKAPTTKTTPELETQTTTPTTTPTTTTTSENETQTTTPTTTTTPELETQTTNSTTSPSNPSPKTLPQSSAGATGQDCGFGFNNNPGLKNYLYVDSITSLTYGASFRPCLVYTYLNPDPNDPNQTNHQTYLPTLNSLTPALCTTVNSTQNGTYITAISGSGVCKIQYSLNPLPPVEDDIQLHPAPLQVVSLAGITIDTGTAIAGAATNTYLTVNPITGINSIMTHQGGSYFTRQYDGSNDVALNGLSDNLVSGLVNGDHASNILKLYGSVPDLISDNYQYVKANFELINAGPQDYQLDTSFAAANNLFNTANYQITPRFLVFNKQGLTAAGSLKDGGVANGTDIQTSQAQVRSAVSVLNLTDGTVSGGYVDSTGNQVSDANIPGLINGDQLTVSTTSENLEAFYANPTNVDGPNSIQYISIPQNIPVISNGQEADNYYTNAGPSSGSTFSYGLDLGCNPNFDPNSPIGRSCNNGGISPLNITANIGPQYLYIPKFSVTNSPATLIYGQSVTFQISGDKPWGSSEGITDTATVASNKSHCQFVATTLVFTANNGYATCTINFTRSNSNNEQTASVTIALLPRTYDLAAISNPADGKVKYQGGGLDQNNQLQNGDSITVSLPPITGQALTDGFIVQSIIPDNSNFRAAIIDSNTVKLFYYGIQPNQSDFTITYSDQPIASGSKNNWQPTSEQISWNIQPADRPKFSGSAFGVAGFH
jgi:hypothetical protein